MLYDPDSIEITPEKIPKYIGFEVEWAGISVDELESCIPHDSRFKAVRDESIKVIDSHICPSCRETHMVVKERHGAELVSPKTKVSRLDHALTMFSGISDEAVLSGAHVNVSTAVHVHVDAVLFDTNTLRRTLEVFASVEDAAYKYFTGDLGEPRVLYVDLYNFAKSMRRFMQVNLPEQGESALYQMPGKYWAWHLSTSDHDGNSRCTIEYRLFNSTADTEKLSEMICFALGCSYLGLTDAKPGPARYFNPKSHEADPALMESVANIVRLGRRLTEEIAGDVT